MQELKCAVCGYVDQGEQPLQKCPVCGADKTKFSPLDSGLVSPETPEPEPPQPSSAPQAVRKWRCQVCGYIHTGAEPPEKCPVCGAPKSKFVLVEEDEPAAEAQASTPAADKEKEADIESPAKPAGKLVFYQRLSRLHAHPIAVHIPNGVLPLTVLFTLLAVVFNSAAFAVAAKYNMIFVCLSMPLVIFTGLIDWRIRFEQRMSRVFGIKMVCAGVVAVLSLVLSIWWIVQPDIYLKGSSAAGFFVVLNLADLAAAAVAGWYGGKLVFPDA